MLISSNVPKKKEKERKGPKEPLTIPKNFQTSSKGRSIAGTGGHVMFRITWLATSCRVGFHASLDSRCTMAVIAFFFLLYISFEVW